MPLPLRLSSASSTSSRSAGNSIEQPKEVFANRYTVEKTLGSGNCGTALLVIDRKDKDDREKKKVLKKVFIGSLQPDETVDAAQEARLLQSLDHPNIVRFYDSFVENEFFCIVTEYCDDGDLDSRIEQYKKTGRRFSEDQVAEWTIELLWALQYMHSRRILHRDLKTRNIFLRSNHVKIGDFGISRILMGSADMASTFVGTPFFMSPEVLKHEGYNSKSDIWSIGCILYELVSLEHAFPATTLMGVMYKITEMPAPEWPSGYSEELGDLYRAIMEKNPDKRPSAGDAMKFPYIQKKFEMLKQTVVERHSMKNRKDVVVQDTDEIARVVSKVPKLADLQRESDDKRYKNLPPRDRMRIKKQLQADEEARRLASDLEKVRMENQARYNLAKQQNNPYASTIAFGPGSAREGDAPRKQNTPVKPVTAPQPLRAKSNDNVFYDEIDRNDDDNEDYDDDDDENERTVVPQKPIHSAVRNYSADDRPITPMKDRMIYNAKVSSLDFQDGIPETADLANTYYDQFDEFESDEDPNNDENAMFGSMERCLSLADETLTREQTLVIDDKQAGAFGPGARDIKIKNFRALTKKLSEDKFTEAYSYLKKVQYDDREIGTEVDVERVQRKLSQIVPDSETRFELEQLLFLEMQRDGIS